MAIQVPFDRQKLKFSIIYMRLAWCWMVDDVESAPVDVFLLTCSGRHGCVLGSQRRQQSQKDVIYNDAFTTAHATKKATQDGDAPGAQDPMDMLRVRRSAFVGF